MVSRSQLQAFGHGAARFCRLSLGLSCALLLAALLSAAGAVRAQSPAPALDIHELNAAARREAERKQMRRERYIRMVTRSICTRCGPRRRPTPRHLWE